MFPYGTSVTNGLRICLTFKDTESETYNASLSIISEYHKMTNNDDI